MNKGDEAFEILKMLFPEKCAKHQMEVDALGKKALGNGYSSDEVTVENFFKARGGGEYFLDTVVQTAHMKKEITLYLSSTEMITSFDKTKRMNEYLHQLIELTK